MRIRTSQTRRLVYAGLVALISGCQTFQGNRPVAILVRDAETKKPIAGADVQISYPLLKAFYEPSCATAKTPADGIARLTAVPSEDALILLEVKVPGYLSEMKDLTPKSIEALERAHFMEKVERRPPSFIVEMYAEPRPTIELIVPTGYKGIVKADVQIKEDAVVAVGQRTFPCRIDPTGAGAVVGATLLKHIDSADFVAKYADGAPIARNAKDPEIGLWWLKKEGDSEHFFIGTQHEFIALRNADRKTIMDSERPAGGGGGGKRGGGGGGRHGGRGGM